MLGKLIGYEMKAYGRILVPVYIALLAMAAILGGLVHFMPSWVTHSILFVFAVIIYVLLMAGVVVVTAILAINRYYGNMLGREGYFMFSLPTSTRTLMFSKALSVVIWTAFGTIVSLAALAMTGLISIHGEGMDYQIVVEGLKEAWRIVRPHMGNAVLWIVILIFQLVAAVMRMYAAVSIGSQFSGHRLPFSILAYVCLKTIEMIIATILSATGLMEHLFLDTITSGSVEVLTSYKLQIIILITFVIMIAVYWLIAWYFTDRKLNLE